MSNIISKEYLEEMPFYIIQNGDQGMYQIRLKSNHFVMANATTESKILDIAKELLMRYNTPDSLKDALRETRTKVPVAEQEHRDKQYKLALKGNDDCYEKMLMNIVDFNSKLHIKKKKVSPKRKVIIKSKIK